ncbi:MAG: substrate-binding domain-containing protein [Treponema sp.]|jgi:DNA-binding LacI/PurR family transcriptional regulator/AraC-like DNA-binding protein|nr:substrate-binding domain-containing protein [Treponema sp.]
MDSKRRIGFILSGIHVGVAGEVWSCFARIARRKGTSLFIFPGGRLNCGQDSENLRNSVYSLVNIENLDGLITWSSTIQYTQSRDEFDHLHQSFDPLPFVSIAYKIPGRSCVEFDAYAGMKALTTHLIKAHGARRIAFIRGPEFHHSAMERFQGYRDALAGAGLYQPASSPLVSSPFDWEAGEAAAAQLFEERHLAPGRDFDALICSSDLMALRALAYFARKGYHIPADFLAAGFNNSEECHITEAPLSTVSIPWKALASRAFGILQGILDRPKRSAEEDIVLDSELVIRESCGCGAGDGVPHAAPHAEEAPLSPRTIAALAAERLHLNERLCGVLIPPLLEPLFAGNVPLLLSRFERLLARFFEAEGDMEKVLLLAGEVMARLPEALRGRVEGPLYHSFFRVRNRETIKMTYAKDRRNAILNSLKCELLGARDRQQLAQSLARYLPRIGITRGAVVLYKDERVSVCAGCFSPEGAGGGEEQPFPAQWILPRALQDHLGEGVFLVQPLFIESRSLGYFLHDAAFYDGPLFEDLRTAVSYALKGIFQLEETERARRTAEQTEWAKSEFIRSLEHKLYEPFASVRHRLEALEKALAAADGGLDAEARVGIAAELHSLRDFVRSRETDTESFVDLAATRVHNYALRKTLINIDDILPGAGNLPLISGDPARLSNAFSLIKESYPGTCTCLPLRKGLEARFKGPLNPAEGGGGNLLLAEQIILMHGGAFAADDAGCAATLPWPCLEGSVAEARPPAPDERILALADPAGLLGPFLDIPIEDNMEKALAAPEKIALVVWNARDAQAGGLAKALLLSSSSALAKAPFLCWGIAPADGTITDAAKKALGARPRGAALLVGSREFWEPIWDDEDDAIRIDSLALFEETAAAVSPSIILLNHLSAEAAEIIRKHPRTQNVPIIMVVRRIGSGPGSVAGVTSLCEYPRLVICHSAAASSPDFRAKLKAYREGEEMLPSHTGAVVKKVLLYFDRHGADHITRWKLADSVNVSEDYLTRIFRLELGLSPWEYLNRYRCFLAEELLLSTSDTILEVANAAGFQDQAYFCRVFKKIRGIAPGAVRKSAEKTVRPPPPSHKNLRRI